MTDVTKALEAAGEATWQRMDALGFDVPGDVHAQMIASAAIAAFHRHMAEHWRWIAPDWFSRHTGLANVVEAAAKGDATP